jgi:hypothetical protein
MPWRENTSANVSFVSSALWPNNGKIAKLNSAKIAPAGNHWTLER